MPFDARLRLYLVGYAMLAGGVVGLLELVSRTWRMVGYVIFGIMTAIPLLVALVRSAQSDAGYRASRDRTGG